MGRGVDYDSAAVQVWYFDAGCDCDADDYGCDCWDYFVESIQNVLMERYQSLYKTDEWDGREVRRVLENGLAKLSVSNYCGTASLSLVPKDDWYYSEQHMEHSANHWCNQVIKGMSEVLEKCFPTSLMTKLGTMSNGVSVFQKAGA